MIITLTLLVSLGFNGQMVVGESFASFLYCVEVETL